MAAFSLITKAIEVLRSLQIQDLLVTDDYDAKKKEKIASCLVLANGMSSSTVQAVPKILNLCFETLLCLCDDPDSDVRTVADESLNKIIRAVADNFIFKVQSELYREIKRNGAARCLRAALWRFGLLSHSIKLLNIKEFASKMVPCILEIVKRNEDIVIETLSESLPLILKALGGYISDKDIQLLLKAFFNNISCNEAAVRRVSANMILIVCLNSRKPQPFLNYAIEQLIDMLFRFAEGNIEAEEVKEDCVNTVFGAFACLKLILPYIDSNSNLNIDFNEDCILDHYICIYELCLFYAEFYTNHNVINAALETLAKLLENPPKNVLVALLSPKGISQCISKLKERGRQWASKISLSTTVMSEDNLGSNTNLFESDIVDIPDTVPKVENWMTNITIMPTVHKTETNTDILDSSQIIETKDLGDYSSLIIGSFENDEIESNSNASSIVEKSEKTMDINLPIRLDMKDEEDLEETTLSIISPHEVTMEQFILQRSNLTIGTLLDNDVPLRFCCRFLVSSFLLTGTSGELVPDKLFRVSVKSLALTCLSNLFRLYPDIFFAKVSKTDEKINDNQMIYDILKFLNHSDPQIRGNISMIIGHLLQGIFARNEEYFNLEDPTSLVSLKNLISLILKGLEDESATTCRYFLTAISAFLPNLLGSEKCEFAIPILKALPNLEKNPYFLVKIKLADIFSSLQYTTIEYLNKKLTFQENVINVLLKLLSNSDQRVRKAAANAITKIIPVLYYESLHEDAVTRKASLYVERYLVSVVSNPMNLSSSDYMKHKLLISSLVEPYAALFRVQDCVSRERIDDTLSRIISLLADRLFVFSSKYLIYGCCEALSILSETYLTTVYPKAWDCFSPADKQVVKKLMKKSNAREEAADNIPGFSNEVLSPISNSLFSQTIILLNSSAHSLDLSIHRHMLLLAGNLASGIACVAVRLKEQQINLKTPIAKNESDKTSDCKYWTFFKEKQNSWNMEQLLKHILKMLNIFQHVIEDLPWPLQQISKSTLPSLTTAQSLSPKRKLLSDQQFKSKSNSSDKISDHYRLSFRFGGKDQLGCLMGRSHYLRLYELLKAAHANYRVTLQQEASETYLGLLNANLQVLSQILEIASINEAGRIAEEILHYLQSTVRISSTKTIECVRQLLKSLFGTNLLLKWPEIYEDQHRMGKGNSSFYPDNFMKCETDFDKGFYEQCFQRPAKLIIKRIKELINNCSGSNELDYGCRFTPLLHCKEERKVTSILQILSRNSDQNSVDSFIRLFEPLVIKSLTEYIKSNSVSLQCQVLMFLSQLVQLHINYCLVDSEQIFIGFVMRQFEFVEEGHIFGTEELLPKIFDFLVRLSYEKYHSKSIIGVPKIIQLCDGLMASGQPPLTHCIPALVPVIEEIFLVRNSLSNISEEKEIETTREVLLSIMLRLVEYHQIVELLAKCLKESRLSSDGNGEEKWRRWSRQTMDVVIPLLSARKIRLETKRADFALMKLFSAVSPTVFRPVDPLLKVLLTMPPSIGKKHNGSLTNENILEFKRWIKMVNVVTFTLISYAKEEVMLSRLSDLSSSIIDLSEIILIPDSSRSVSGDPLNVSGVLEPFILSPEKILSRFIFRVIRYMSEALIEISQKKNFMLLNEKEVDDENNYIVQQFSLFLQLCIYMFETGSHYKVAKASIQLVQSHKIEKDDRLLLDNLNDLIIRIGKNYPILTSQWIYLLTLFGFDDMKFWSKVIGLTQTTNNARLQVSINAEILRRASIILFCDHACESTSLDLERLDWILRNYLTTTINLTDEPPVRELLTVTVHRESESSGLFLRALIDKYNNPDEVRPEGIRRLLCCLEGANQAQSGKLLLFLVPRLLKIKYLVLSRMAAKIASRRFELLLALGKNESLTQMPKEDFKGLMETLKRKGLSKKYGALVGSLNKLATSHYDLESLELDTSKPFDPTKVKEILLDRSWFLSQVKSRCCNPCVNYGCLDSAWLLSHLNLDECMEIFSSEDFNVKFLHECVIVGTRLSVQAAKKIEFNSYTALKESKESVLYTAMRKNLILQVRNIVQNLPKYRDTYELPNEDHRKLSKNLLTKAQYQNLFSIAPAVASYIDSLAELSLVLEPEHGDEFARFALLCLEIGATIIFNHLNLQEFDILLNCAQTILRQPVASRSLASFKHKYELCSAITALESIIRYCCGENSHLEVDLECSGLREAMADDITRGFGVACATMAALVNWIERRYKKNGHCIENNDYIPNFLTKSLESIIISIARLPLVNSFVIIPPLLWKHGSTIVGTGPSKCQFALLISEPNCLPEIDVLEEFIFRISFLGWNSRQQFEEIWMVLLGVLNVSHMSSEDKFKGTNNSGHSASLAVQAITNLLVQTLMLPCPGNSNNGVPIQHPRDPQLSLQKKSTQRLFTIQDLLFWKYKNNTMSWSKTNFSKFEHVFQRGNLEPCSTGLHKYAHGQLSISYLWSLCSLHEDKLNFSTIALKKRRDEALDAVSLDVNSCLKFLLELYATWMLPGSKLPLRLLHEVVKSLLFLSELFVERSQYQWMLDSCMELWKFHLSEDELIRKHLIIAICKASAVLTPLDTETLDKVKRLIDGSLKRGSLCMRIATLHAILYLLQSAVLANCDETMNAIHPLIIDYIQRYIVQDYSRISNQSEEHHCILWALVFFLLEHAEDMFSDVEAPAVFELILSLVCSQNISVSLHRMLLQGLERLVATRSVVGKITEQIVLISIERLRQVNPALSLPALQLFLTCMYTDTADRFNQPEIDELLPDMEPELLVKLIERSSIIFDKIKKGYPMEVQILCVVLSEILIDFFPPMEILTKVIGEFLSPKQPHPRLMSAIVFKVCERACNSTQLNLLQTWVVFSIQNFIQSLPLIMSTWCLSCFFISTSTNPWLRALFPYVQSRIGKYEYEDKKILCLAAFDFYSQLTNKSQKETFIKTFEDAAKNPGTPFVDILALF